MDSKLESVRVRCGGGYYQPRPWVHLEREPGQTCLPDNTCRNLSRQNGRIFWILPSLWVEGVKAKGPIESTRVKL